MLSTNAANIIATSLLALVVFEFFNRFVVGRWVSSMYKKVEVISRDIIDSYKKEDEVIKDSGIKKEWAQAHLINKKRQELGYLTKAIAYTELLLFGGLSFLLYKDNLRVVSIENMKLLFAAFIAWMALKIFGNYGQWSGAIFGRTTYYIFLLGSLANVIFCSVLGFVVSFFFFNK